MREITETSLNICYLILSSTHTHTHTNTHTSFCLSVIYVKYINGVVVVVHMGAYGVCIHDSNWRVRAINVCVLFKSCHVFCKCYAMCVCVSTTKKLICEDNDV